MGNLLKYTGGKNTKVQRFFILVIAIFLINGTIISSIGNTREQLNIQQTTSKILYVGGEGPNNYTKIQDAIDNANDGDIVFVYNDSSPYIENIMVNKSINIIGEDRKSTFIDGNKSGNVVYVTADLVNISGFTIYNGDNGIEIYSNFNNISNNIISNNWNAGLIISYSSNNTIIGNDVSNSGSGINLFFSRDNIISDNSIISNNYEGIYFYRSKNNTILENKISDNGIGISIHFQLCYQNIFYHNNFIENDQQAYDGGDNIWDNEYPSCGNYWSDYNGSDKDGDGVGDVPYKISGERVDRFPLIESYGMTALRISLREGLFKLSGTIKNIGNKTAFNVQWKILIDYGLVLIGRISEGIIPKPLQQNDYVKVSSGIILGFGKIIFTFAVWADNAPYISKSIPGTLIFIFILF